MALSAEKEKLTHQLEEIEGLPADEAAGVKQLALSKSEKKKRAPLKIQLTFRQNVLGSNCEKTLFYLSLKGNIQFYRVTQ